MSSPAYVPLQTLDADFLTGLFVVVEPIAILEGYIGEFCAGFQADSLPLALFPTI